MKLTELKETDQAVLSVPEAGELFRLGRAASYAAAKRGDLPTIRLGRRVWVPVPALQELFGILGADEVKLR